MMMDLEYPPRNPVRDRLIDWLIARALPTSIDGTDISSATIDGQQVQEITVDGQTVFNYNPYQTPSSTIAWFDAQALSLSDGDSVNTWTDEQGSYDLDNTNGSPSYTTSGIGTDASVDFSDGDEFKNTSFPSQSQPFTIIGVIDDSGGQAVISNDTTGRRSVEANQSGDNTTLVVKNDGNFDGNSTNQPELFVGVFDGSSSFLRQNGTQTASGDLGTGSWADLRVGTSPQGNVNDFTGLIGELKFYDTALSSSTISDEESHLSSKWGITI